MAGCVSLWAGWRVHGVSSLKVTVEGRNEPHLVCGGEADSEQVGKGVLPALPLSLPLPLCLRGPDPARLPAPSASCYGVCHYLLAASTYPPRTFTLPSLFFVGGREVLCFGLCHPAEFSRAGIEFLPVHKTQEEWRSGCSLLYLEECAFPAPSTMAGTSTNHCPSPRPPWVPVQCPVQGGPGLGWGLQRK